MGVDYRAWVLPKRRTFEPTSLQLAAFVEAVRASKWTHASFHRPPPRVGITVRRGERDRERDLPARVTAEDIDRLRRPDAPLAVDDELRFRFDVFWSTGCVPAHVIANAEAELSDDDATVEDPPDLDERRILMVEDEHPCFYELQLLVARDFIEVWGNNVATPGESRCACENVLSYDGMTEERWPANGRSHVRATCPACGRAYDPAADPPSIVVVDSAYERAAAHVKRAERPYPRLLSRLAVVLDFSKDWPVLPAGTYLTVDPVFVQLCERVFGEPFEVVNVFV